MEERLQELVAFHLTGKRTGGGLAAIDGADLRPALFVGYRDLTRLRYDYPLVLARDTAADRTCVQSLSGIVDEVVHKIAQGDDGDRLTRHAIQVEERIRAAVAAGESGPLAELWDQAAARLTAEGDDLLKDSLKRARAALKADGEVLDCGETTPLKLFRHIWSVTQQGKARRMRDEIGRLIQKLSDILRADFSQSKSGRSPESLQAAIGKAHAEVFDFSVMSRILSKQSPETELPESRRQRIERLLAVLKSQRFFATPHGNGPGPHSFFFSDCAGALAAYRERLPQAIELTKAMAIAELEIDAQYNEARHDPLFAEFGADGLDEQEMARFPDYLIHLKGSHLHGDELENLMEILSAGLPVKVLVQIDDLFEETAIGKDAHLSFGPRNRQLVNMAIGLNEVFVLQAPASHLFQFRERILKGFTYAGPALFSIYTGAGGQTNGLPPYLAAAAAMESRAFPALIYDPAAGANWAARFHLAANPQVDLDWPAQRFAYEDEDLQRVEVALSFTPVDFVACDSRFGRHFAQVPREKWDAGLIPVEEFLKRRTKGAPDRVPSLLMVDGENRLRKVVVDEQMIRAAQRCREAWHSLQELGGIHNSHAEQLLAREKQAWEESRQQEPAAAPQTGVAEGPEAAPAPAPAVSAEPEPAPSPDEPYIDTARCTTCNECIKINDRMFVYNENKQAYLKDPGAGTYRQLVEAAESCKVAIIHPGKPRNPNEPGLEDLIARAEPFR